MNEIEKTTANRINILNETKSESKDLIVILIDDSAGNVKLTGKDGENLPVIIFRDFKKNNTT